MKEQEHFIPWYQPDATVDSTDICRRLRSAAIICTHKLPPWLRPQKQKFEPTVPRKAYRRGDVVFMELTVRTRKDLSGEIPFGWSDDIYHDICVSWYEEQKKRKVRDVVFLCGAEVKVATNRHYDCCLVCWYLDGVATAFVPGVENGTAVIQHIRVESSYRRPVFNDNADSFKGALQAIAEYAGFEWWKNRFQKGLSIMNQEHVTYCGQEDTFCISEPYFKYLLAAQVTQLGMGMGSWYDLPTMGTEDHKYYTDLFIAERDKALMYAVNNC